MGCKGSRVQISPPRPTPKDVEVRRAHGHGEEMSDEIPVAPSSPPPYAGTDAAAVPPPPGHRAHLRFIDQLSHRNIVRIAVLYVVVCWLILEPVHVVFHMLEAPAWANRAVLFLMALGLPAVLLFAWVSGIAPGGRQPPAGEDGERSTREQAGRRLNRAIVAVMGV